MILFYQNLSIESDTSERECNRMFLGYFMECLLVNDRDGSEVAAMLIDSIVRIVEMLANLDVGKCAAIGDATLRLLNNMLDEPQENPKMQ